MAITYHAGRRIQGLSQGTVTSSDDLTTDKGWTTSNGISGNGYNASDYVDFKLICPDSSSLAGGRVLVDLQHADYLNGSNLSNTAFTARIKINYSALDQASGNENKSYIGFYSNDSWGGSTQDAFVLQLKLDYGQSSKKFYVEIMNDEVFEGSAHQTEFTSTTPTVDTDYYVEFTKNGNVHTIRITTNSDYTGGETQSITYGGVENLRYFGCKARGDTQANGGNAQGKIEPDIGIWNGVTTVDSTPATWTNPVCSGTISSTATMGSNGDFDVSYTTVASKTGSGQRGCNAWEFDGQSASPYTGRNAVKGATNSDFSVSSSTAFTISAWVKLNTLGQQHTILGYSGAYTNTFWTNLGISAANKVEGHTATNGISNNYIPTGNSLSVDTWHHCVFIHKADKTVTVYLDADTANKGTGTGDTGSASAGFWTIAGRWGYNVTIPTFPFLDGFIDQATLWDVALSEADVTTLYNGGRLTPPSVSQNNIKGYWTFSETSGGATNKAV